MAEQNHFGNVFFQSTWTCRKDVDQFLRKSRRVIFRNNVKSLILNQLFITRDPDLPRKRLRAALSRDPRVGRGLAGKRLHGRRTDCCGCFRFKAHAQNCKKKTFLDSCVILHFTKTEVGRLKGRTLTDIEQSWD